MHDTSGVCPIFFTYIPIIDYDISINEAKCFTCSYLLVMFVTVTMVTEVDTMLSFWFILKAANDNPFKAVCLHIHLLENMAARKSCIEDDRIIP